MRRGCAINGKTPLPVKSEATAQEGHEVDGGEMAKIKDGPVAWAWCAADGAARREALLRVTYEVRERRACWAREADLGPLSQHPAGRSLVRTRLVEFASIRRGFGYRPLP